MRIILPSKGSSLVAYYSPDWLAFNLICKHVENSWIVGGGGKIQFIELRVDKVSRENLTKEQSYIVTGDYNYVNIDIKVSFEYWLGEEI